MKSSKKIIASFSVFACIAVAGLGFAIQPSANSISDPFEFRLEQLQAQAPVGEEKLMAMQSMDLQAK